MKKYLSYLSVAVVIFGAIWWAATVDATASDAKKIAESNQKINEKLTAIIVADNAKLETLFKLAGIDEDQIRKWREMPKEPVRDSSGNILEGVKWLDISEDLNVGVIMMKKDSSVLIDTAWDIR